MSRYLLPLDLQLFAQEKTEPATPKKRREQREKGQIAKSSELPAAFILLFTFAFLYAFGGLLKNNFMNLFSDVFRNDLLMDASQENVRILFNKLILKGLILLSPVFILTLLIALIGNYLQFGFLFTMEPMKMKLNKLNPIEGFKRIFSLRSLIEFLKSIFKMAIIGILVYTTLWGEKAKLIMLGRVPLESSFSHISSITLLLGIKIGVVLVILAVLDFIYQKYEYEKKMRMSKQDIKDEYKKTEGDPLVKGKIREKQRRMALQRMMQEIPKADVVITNPTHYAVAIQYDANNMQAPTVIAKGADFVALKIKEKAKEHGIITMENKPLARALYSQVEIGESVPAEMFQAVAEVLAYVYKLKGKTGSMRKGGARP